MVPLEGRRAPGTSRIRQTFVAMSYCSTPSPASPRFRRSYPNSDILPGGLGVHPVGVDPAPTAAPSATTWPSLRQPRHPVVPPPGSVHLGGSSAPPRTLLDILATTAAAHPDRPAIDDGRRCLDYAELRYEAHRIAAALAAHGGGRGDRVGVRMASGSPHDDTVIAAGAVLGGSAFLTKGQRVPPGHGGSGTRRRRSPVRGSSRRPDGDVVDHRANGGFDAPTEPRGDRHRRVRLGESCPRRLHRDARRADGGRWSPARSPAWSVATAVVDPGPGLLAGRCAAARGGERLSLWGALTRPGSDRSPCGWPSGAATMGSARW